MFLLITQRYGITLDTIDTTTWLEQLHDFSWNLRFI